MNPFPEELHFDFAGEENNHMLIRLTKEFPVSTSFGVIKIPIDFTSDGASIPQAAESFVGERMTYIKEALLHDYIYNTPELDLSRRSRFNSS